MPKYWETETPTTITTNKNVLQFYRDAGKLSVARLPWLDKDGDERPGKTVCLDIEAITESGAPVMKDVRAVFTDVIQEIDRALSLAREMPPPL